MTSGGTKLTKLIKLIRHHQETWQSFSKDPENWLLPGANLPPDPSQEPSEPGDHGIAGVAQLVFGGCFWGPGLKLTLVSQSFWSFASDFLAIFCWNPWNKLANYWSVGSTLIHGAYSFPKLGAQTKDQCRPQRYHNSIWKWLTVEPPKMHPQKQDDKYMNNHEYCLAPFVILCRAPCLTTEGGSWLADQHVLRQARYQTSSFRSGSM